MVSYKTLVSAWDKFFFAPRPTEGMAIFRILWCSMLFCYLLIDIGNAVDFYGPHAILSWDTVRLNFQYPHASLFNVFGVSYGSVYGIMAIYGVALIFSIIGYHTRASLLVALFCMVSFHQRNIWLLCSSEILMRIIMILLVCSPCGHSLSVDSLLGRNIPRFRRPREWAPWAWRLIQIQLSVVYVWTVWQKFKGHTWFDGTALYYATRLDSMKNYPVPFVLDSMLFLKVGTWGTLILEFALGTFIWVKELRKPLILIGIAFHLGIEYMMSIPFFEYVMIILLLTFYTPEEYLAFVTRIKVWWVEQLSRSRLSDRYKEKLLWIAD